MAESRLKGGIDRVLEYFTGALNVQFFTESYDSSNDFLHIRAETPDSMPSIEKLISELQGERVRMKLVTYRAPLDEQGFKEYLQMGDNQDITRLLEDMEEAKSDDSRLRSLTHELTRKLIEVSADYLLESEGLGIRMFGLYHKSDNQSSPLSDYSAQLSAVVGDPSAHTFSTLESSPFKDAFTGERIGSIDICYKEIKIDLTHQEPQDNHAILKITVSNPADFEGQAVDSIVRKIVPKNS